MESEGHAGLGALLCLNVYEYIHIFLTSLQCTVWGWMNPVSTEFWNILLIIIIKKIYPYNIDSYK